MKKQTKNEICLLKILVLGEKIENMIHVNLDSIFFLYTLQQILSRHTPYMHVHIEDTLATQAPRVRASLLSFWVHYQYSSKKKWIGFFRSKSTVIFRGYHGKRYTRRELGTFFCAILRLVISPFEMHCRVDDKHQQERSGDWERGMLKTLHR